MVKIGDKIKILYMDGEPQYTNKEGEVTLIDDAGQIHGTWGGCAIIPEIDEFEVIENVNEGFEIVKGKCEKCDDAFQECFEDLQSINEAQLKSGPWYMHNSNKHNTTSWGSKLGPSVQKDFRDTRTNGKYGYIHGAESDYVGWEERFFNFINSYDELKDDELLHEEELIQNMPEIKKAAQAIQSAREEKEELENQKKSLENRRGYNRAVDIIKKLNTGTITKEQFDNLAEQGGLGDIAEEILSLDAEIQEATKHYLELLAESDKKYHDLVAKYGTLNAQGSIQRLDFEQDKQVDNLNKISDLSNLKDKIDAFLEYCSNVDITYLDDEIQDLYNNASDLMVDIVDAYESGDKDALRDAVDSFDDYREQFSHVIIDDDGSVSYDNYATQDDIVDTTLGIFDTSNNFKRDVYGIDPSEYGIHSKSTPYSPYDESLEESLTEIDEITSYKYLLRESYLDSNLSKTSKAKLQFMVNEGLHPAVISRFIERHSNEVQN